MSVLYFLPQVVQTMTEFFIHYYLVTIACIYEMERNLQTIFLCILSLEPYLKTLGGTQGL